MTTIEQARAVEQRLRGCETEFTDDAADTIASLISVHEINCDTLEAMRVELEEAQETIQHLNHALRDATEAPTFMGEPVDNELIAPLVRSQYQHKQAQQRITELEVAQKDSAQLRDILKAFDAAVDCARLAGQTEEAKGRGQYTERDSRFYMAMMDSIRKHRAAIVAGERT